MSSAKQEILQWFCRTEFSGEVLRFAQLLIDGAVQALGKSQIDAESFATSRIRSHWNWLLQLIDEDGKRGLEPLFTILDPSSRFLRWVPREPSPCDSRVRRRRQLLQARPEILRRIESLSDRHFEALGCVAARLCGASEVYLTPAGDDKGVDFFASIQWAGRSHVFSHRRGPLRIVGQSKNYGEKVDVDRTSIFIQKLTEVFHRDPAVEPIVPAWFRAGSGPIVGWMISQQGLQEGGISKARHHGVVYSDARDIAEIFSLASETAAATAVARADRMSELILAELPPGEHQGRQ